MSAWYPSWTLSKWKQTYWLWQIECKESTWQVPLKRVLPVVGTHGNSFGLFCLSVRLVWGGGVQKWYWCVLWLSPVSIWGNLRHPCSRAWGMQVASGNKNPTSRGKAGKLLFPILGVPVYCCALGWHSRVVFFQCLMDICGVMVRARLILGEMLSGNSKSGSKQRSIADILLKVKKSRAIARLVSVFLSGILPPFRPSALL